MRRTTSTLPRHDGGVVTRTFDVETAVSVAPRAVIDFLLRLDQHRGLHAYVQRAEPAASGVTEEGAWTDWRVSETPRFGPFRYTLRFRARMTRTSTTSLTGRVRPAPGCLLTTHTTAIARNGGTHVTESVTVSAPWPLVGYVQRQARIAHTRMFELLPQALGDPPRS